MALAARAPDVILRPSIPLSATSDQPLADLPRPPESASNDPVDQAAGTAKEISPQDLAAADEARKGDPATADEVTTGDDPKTDDGKVAATDDKTKTAKADEIDVSDLPKDLPGYAVREITKVRKAAREARAAIEAEAATAKKAAEDAKADAATARKELADLRAKPAETVVEEPAADPRPTRDEFDDPDLYDEALTDWGKREGVRAAEQKAATDKATEEAEATRVATEKANEAREAEVTAFHTKWQATRTEALTKYPDYAEVAEADPKDGGPVITDAMAAAIMQVENGPDVAYHLGQNTDEAARIAALTNPVMHFIEIGKIAERLANPVRRRAPRQEPIEPIDGGTAPADTSEQEPDMEAYAARRNKELVATRRPFFPQGGIH